MPRSFISKYENKNVETIQGSKIGKVVDVVYSPNTGKILAFVVRVKDPTHPLAQFPAAEKNHPDRVVVPFGFFLFSDIRLLLKEEEIQNFLQSRDEDHA